MCNLTIECEWSLHIEAKLSKPREDHEATIVDEQYHNRDSASSFLAHTLPISSMIVAHLGAISIA